MTPSDFDPAQIRFHNKRLRKALSDCEDQFNLIDWKHASGKEVTLEEYNRVCATMATITEEFKKENAKLKRLIDLGERYSWLRALVRMWIRKRYGGGNKENE